MQGERILLHCQWHEAVPNKNTPGETRLPRLREALLRLVAEFLSDWFCGNGWPGVLTVAVKKACTMLKVFSRARLSFLWPSFAAWQQQQQQVQPHALEQSTRRQSCAVSIPSVADHDAPPLQCRQIKQGHKQYGGNMEATWRQQKALKCTC